MTPVRSGTREVGRPGKFTLADRLVDPAARRISRDGQEQRLSPKAMRVLVTLGEADGGVVCREELLEKVWPEVTVGEEVLTQAITELRRVLGDSAKTPRFIETVHKSGYRLLVPLRAYEHAEKLLRLGDALLSSDGTQQRPLDFQTYGLFLEACQAFDRGGAQNIHAAVAMFADVTRSLPDFAPAYAGLARSLAFVDMYYGPPGDHVARALQACETGLRIDPHSHDVLAAQGTAYSAAGDATRAFASFESALRQRPDCSATHYLLGRALFAEGSFALAATMQEQAARLDPQDFHSLLLAAKARRRLGDEVGARADLVRADARIEQHLLAYPNDFRALCDKACCLIELDQKDAALDLTGALLTHSDPMAYYLVCFLARAGEIPFALELLEEIVEVGWSHAPVLRHDPDIDPLRGEARFRHIEHRLEVH